MTGTKTDPKKRISAQEAAQAAAKYYVEVSGDTSSMLKVSETDLSEGGHYWLITLSIINPSNPLAVYGYGVGRSEYKIFKVDAKTSEVVSMKLREKID